MTVPFADRKPEFLDGFTYTHNKPEVKVVYRDKPETQQQQRRIANRSVSGSSKSTGRNARRRKRNSRGSKSRSRSRIRDRKIPSRSRSRDHKIQGKPTHGRSAARRSRSRRRSRSTSGGGSRRSKRSSSYSSTSPITGSRYSMDCSSTDDDDKRKAQKRSIHESKDYIVIKDKNTEPEFEEWRFGSVGIIDNKHDRCKLKSKLYNSTNTNPNNYIVKMCGCFDIFVYKYD